MIRVQKFHDMTSSHMSDADSDYNPRFQDKAFDYDSSDQEGYLFEEENDEFMNNAQNNMAEFVLQAHDVDYDSEYANSDDDIVSQPDLDDEGNLMSEPDMVDHIVSQRDRSPWYDPECPMDEIQFQVGMKFDSPDSFRTTVKDSTIANGFTANYVRGGTKSVEFKCKSVCPWRIYASWNQAKETFVVKALNDHHTCNRVTDSCHVTYKWIANHFLERIRMTPDWKAVDMMREIYEVHGVNVSRQTCNRAKAEARKMIEGSLNDHYHWLPAYVAELKARNTRSTFVMVNERDNLDSSLRFKRLYVCFKPVADGFKAGCRKVIGLDGCFLKTIAKGLLLSAIGKDGNDQMYPISWAVVEGENENSWKWFIELLMENLEIVDGNGWTIISDQQKVHN